MFDYSISIQGNGVDTHVAFHATPEQAIALFDLLKGSYPCVSLDHEHGNVRSKGF